MLYPVEIKLTGNPKATMAATNRVLGQGDRKEAWDWRNLKENNGNCA